MGLSNSNNHLFDPIRKIWVPPLPEEIVRQTILQNMVGSLGYPPALIAVEKEISALPHLADPSYSNLRRADIICFAKNITDKYPLYPLLLVECKAERVNEAVLRQALGYNQTVQAFFICIAAPDKIKTFWHDDKQKKYVSCDFLPKYEELLRAIGRA